MTSLTNQLTSSYFCLKLEKVQGRGYETHKTTEIKKNNDESKEAEAEEKMEADTPFTFVIDVNHLLLSRYFQR